MKKYTEQQAVELADAYASYKSIRVADLENTGSILDARLCLERLCDVQVRLGIQIVPAIKIDKIFRKLDALLEIN